MDHFMMDLETRGNSPGCQILSVGLIAFNPFAASLDDVFEDDGFYAVVSKESCDEAMLHVDQSTMNWWQRQSEEARQVLYQSEDPGASQPLVDVIVNMVGYVRGHVTPRNARVWGNGADFDNPIMGVAARMVHTDLPWYDASKPDQSPLPWQWGNRCYRTIKNLHEILGVAHRAPPATRTGTYHNALDDARTQALHMWDIVSTLRDRAG